MFINMLQNMYYYGWTLRFSLLTAGMNDFLRVCSLSSSVMIVGR